MIRKAGLAAVKGFQFAGVVGGGAAPKKNIGLIYTDEKETYGTAVYTKNDVVAAPIVICKEYDKLSNRKRAILINSGNANAFTGAQGFLDARFCAERAANLLQLDTAELYIGSTGVIGQKLEMDAITEGMECAMKNLHEGQQAANDFNEAIMTTDTKMKQASVSCEIGGKTVNIAACVKGAGMIMPDMATMICVVLTDAKIAPELMPHILQGAVEDTFNCITVDGDTSTNDSVFFLANGAAGNPEIDDVNGADYQTFATQFHALMEHMAKEVVKDGEGVTKFITIQVEHVPTREQGKAVAFSIANSPLVKTAFYGQQLNWGRLMMAIGKAQTGLDCNVIDIYVNGFAVLENGEPVLQGATFKQAEATLVDQNVDVLIDFKQGDVNVTVWTCDYSLDYIKINADYMT